MNAFTEDVFWAHWPRLASGFRFESGKLANEEGVNPVLAVAQSLGVNFATDAASFFPEMERRAEWWAGKLAVAANGGGYSHLLERLLESVPAAA